MAGTLSYVFGIVTGVLFLVIDRDRPFVRFHAIQSIVFSLAFFGLWIGITVLGLVLEIIPVVGWLVGLLLAIAVGFGGFVLWLYAMYQAFQGREWEMPGLGALVRKHAVPTGAPPAGAAMALVAALATAAAPLGSLEAQGFEGTVVQRSVSVTSDGIYELLGDDLDEVDVEALFAVPLEEVFALAEPDVGLAEADRSEIRVKGTKLRGEMGGEDGYVVLDVESGLVRMIQPSERMYVEFSPEQLEATAARPGGAGMADEEAGNSEEGAGEVRPLGKERTVAGMRAEGYEIVDGEETTYAWMTRDHEGLGRMMEALIEWSASMGDEDAPAELRLLEHGVPLLTQTYRGGYGVGDYDVEETVSVTEEELSDELFEVPAGYTKQSMFGMGGGG